MSPIERFFLTTLLAALAATPFAAHAATGFTENILHAFKGTPDGSSPRARLLLGSDGNFYGTTGGGGGSLSCPQGCGTVFRVQPDGKTSILYTFKGGSDGAYPEAGLIEDAAGNLYGTTTAGGSADVGTVFEITTNRKEKVLYAFQGGSDGRGPSGGLIIDNAGNLYGVTAQGGDMGQSACDFIGCGTVFKLAPDGTETVLYAFQGNSDGMSPWGGLVLDSQGNLFGATGAGGTGRGCNNGTFGCGTIFEISSGGAESILYTFQGGSDGDGPNGDLILDGSGNFYGTVVGDVGTGCGGSGCGGVFKLASDGTESTLYAFQGGNDGSEPLAGVIADSAGDLFGTTATGGSFRCHGGGCGTVFELTPDGAESVLFAFHQRLGKQPTAALVLGSNGALYGTTPEGGKHGDGVVFELSP